MKFLSEFRNFASSLIRKSTRVLLLVVMLGIAHNAASQNHKAEGTIIDKSDNQPVIGAFVFFSDLKDSTKRIATTTDVNGKFVLSGLKNNSYNLTIQSINYKLMKQVITLSKPETNLGTLALEMDSKVLNEVVVVGQGTAVQKGDTTVMTAESFKVTQDANAEELVKKMPGISVENGTIKARGENVGQVLVDGKPFFGDDPSIALRNLPAEVVDRVQVYNRLSDQAELTGFDDGESTRTINIITKRDNKYSTFGKVTAGTDFTDKYLAGGNINLFSGPRRITLNGMTNNINTANFAMQDLIGATGGGGGFGRGGFGGRSFFGSSGIMKSSSAGLNYTDNWGKKIAVTASYMFNASENTTIKNTNTEYLLIDKSAVDSSHSITTNYNHRVNMRIEYNIDSLNSMIIVPRFSIQNNSSESNSLNLLNIGEISSLTQGKTTSDNIGYNFGNDLTWRHKFMKKGRTLSVRSSISYDKRDNDTKELVLIDTHPDNLLTDGFTSSLTVNTNLNYTEPISKFSQLQLSLNNRYNKGDNDREVFEMADDFSVLGRFDSLSNNYDNEFMANRVGLSYLYSKGKLNFSTGVNYERSDLTGKQIFPSVSKVSETFQTFLPNLMINYKFSSLSNLRIFYRSDSDEPSISELQSSINNSDRRRIRTGNPNLRQEYSHMANFNYSYANPTSGFNAFVFFMGRYTKDVISSKTIYAADTMDLASQGFNVVLLPGSQLSYPVNLDNSYSLTTVINVSYFLKPIKSNVSLTINPGYSLSPQYSQMFLNKQNSYSLFGSLSLTSNISANVDFNLSYNGSYTLAKSSLDFIKDRESWNHGFNGRVNLIFWKGIVFTTDLSARFNGGTDMSADYTKDYYVWNASLGKKFLKNNAAEIRVGAYDILDQNNSISRSVSASEIVDSRTNAYRRYFLVLFSYNIRSKRAQPQQSSSPGRGQFGPGMGMPPGGRPGGMPPGGFHNH